MHRCSVHICSCFIAVRLLLHAVIRFFSSPNNLYFHRCFSQGHQPLRTSYLLLSLSQSATTSRYLALASSPVALHLFPLSFLIAQRLLFVTYNASSHVPAYRLLFNAALSAWNTYVLGSTRPVARYWGLESECAFLGGEDFCSYYMLNTNFFLAQHNLGDTKTIWGRTYLEWPPWLRTWAQHSAVLHANASLTQVRWFTTFLWTCTPSAFRQMKM